MTVVDRTAAFAEGAPRIPRRVVYIAFAAAALLAGLGVLGEDYFSSIGLNPVAGKSPPVVVPSTAAPEAPQLDASLPAFMGIARLAPTMAPEMSLVDESGAAVSLAKFRGKVVVLSFFNASCSDICPVLLSELALADVDLGKAASRVMFLTVNSDPLQTSVSPTTAAVIRARSSPMSNWQLFGGSLRELDTVWRSYGITINVSPSTDIVAHTDSLYFIDPTGRLRFRATPYADENTNGSFSLSRPSILRWAKGIATYSDDLLSQQR